MCRSGCNWKSSPRAWVGNLGFDLDAAITDIGIEAVLANPQTIHLGGGRQHTGGGIGYALSQRHGRHTRRRRLALSCRPLLLQPPLPFLTQWNDTGLINRGANNL